MFNNREQLLYYVYKESRLYDFNDDNLWDVGAFGGVVNTEEVQERGWAVGDQTIQLF